MSSLAPADRQGGAQGLYQSLSGGAILAAGVWAGLAWHGDGTLPLLVSGCVAAGLAAAMLAFGSVFSASSSAPAGTAESG